MNPFTNIWKWTVTTGIAVVCAAAPQAVFAGANEYGIPHTLNVGVLRIDSTGQTSVPATAELSAPYVFYVLNNRLDIKPAVWQLVNPLAPKTVDADINSRFGNAYTPDAVITPNMAPYWEVDITKQDATSLRPFDLLLISTPGAIQFSLAERKALTQYVDQGGTLWIDARKNGAATEANPNYISSTTLAGTNPFRAAMDGTVASSNAPVLDNAFDPLTTTPNLFSSTALESLGQIPATFQPLINTDIAIAAKIVPDASIFHAILGATATVRGETIVAGDYGSGHVIIDSVDISGAINDEVGVGDGAEADVNTVDNVGYLCGDNFSNAPTLDLKFLVNILSYATESSTPNGNVRGNNAVSGNVAGALTSLWQYAYPSTGGSAPKPEGVATYGQFAYTTDSAGDLNCFNVDPGETVDGTVDEGTPDYSLGAPYDIVWSANVAANTGGSCSAPTVAQADIGGANVPVVLVEDSGGSVHVFDATPLGGGGMLSATAKTAFPTLAPNPAAGSFSGSFVPAPVYYRGFIYAAQPDGSIDAFSLQGYKDYSVATGVTETPLQAPLIGSVPSTDTGGYSGLDIVGYVPYADRIAALELGTRDEHLRFNTYAAPNSEYNGKISDIPGLSSLGVVGSQEDTNNHYTGKLIYFNEQGLNGALQFVSLPASSTPPVLSSTLPVAASPVDTWADYWADPSTGESITRSTISAETAAGSTGYVVQGAALGPDNVLYFTENSGGNNPVAAIEAVAEQAPADGANTNIKWKFALTNTTITNPTADGIMQYKFAGFQFVGPPMVDNSGYVYAVATNGTTTRVLCFFGAAQIQFDQPAFQGQLSVSQVDEFGSTETVQTQQYNNGVFTNFSPTNDQPIVSSVTVPLPLTISGSSQGSVSGTQITYLDTAWNAQPLLSWYTEIDNVAATPNTVRKIGDYVYFGTSGQTYAVYTNPQNLGLIPSSTDRSIDAYNFGKTGFADYRFVQVNGSKFNPVQQPPAGTDKYVVTAGANGIEGLGYKPILIADSSRIVELDPSSNATWACDGTTQIMSNGAAALQPSTQSIRPLARPTTISQINPNNYLIADTGNNRCVQFDRAGNVVDSLTDGYGNNLAASYTTVTAPYVTTNRVLEISTFSDPTGLLPAGASLTLNQPSSVLAWFTYEYNNANGSSLQAILVHYLVADTGDFRLLDIVDRYSQTDDANGIPIPGKFAIQTDTDYHRLWWTSRISDLAQRNYEFVSAQPVLSPTPTAVTDDGSTYYVVNDPAEIIAGISNYHIPALVTTTATNLSDVDSDSAGSSIVLMKYVANTPYSAAPAANKNGLPIQLLNQVAYDTPSGGPSASSAVVIPLHGLHSVYAYNLNYKILTAGNLVISDDDGVFDGAYGTSTNQVLNASVLAPISNPTGWHFGQTEYTGLVAQYDALENALLPTGAPSTVSPYSGTPFNSASALRVSGGNYLIANRGTSGNPNAIVPASTDFGGNVFSVEVNRSSGTPVDNLNGPIYGLPQNTGALSGPTFALLPE